MILTPTYHVFDMYKVHQDAQVLAVNSTFGTYENNGVTLPQVTVEFDEAIKTTNLEESDIQVSGFIKSVTGEVAEVTLTGSNLIKVSTDFF
jgi:alpha-L-arabinofuranosidase